MARNQSVQTASGMLIVKQGVNARNQVTGRVSGVTYTGATWDDVVSKIQEAYSIQYEWTRWIMFKVDLDRFHNDSEHDVNVAFQWSEVMVSQFLTKPDFYNPRVMVDGFMVLDNHCTEHSDGSQVPRFLKGVTIQEALGAPCVPWTEAHETFARDVVNRLRATAEGIKQFLANDDLAKAIDALPSNPGPHQLPSTTLNHTPKLSKSLHNALVCINVGDRKSVADRWLRLLRTRGLVTYKTTSDGSVIRRSTIVLTPDGCEEVNRA